MSPTIRGALVRQWGLAALVVLVAGPGVTWADGWHNAALATGNLDDWLNQQLSGLQSSSVRGKQPVVGNAQLQSGNDIEALKGMVKGAKPSVGKKPVTIGGGKIEGALTPQQMALLGQKSKDCLEVLGCMDPKNIVPGEFPAFQLNQIPKYREAAKGMLRLMGPSGASAVAGQLRAEVMGMSTMGGFDVSPHPEYLKDLLELLKDHAIAGNLSGQQLLDLQEAAAGAKTGPSAALAQEIQRVLSQLKNVSVTVLLDWADQAADDKRKQFFYSAIKAKLSEATVSELIAVKKSKADSATKQQADRELAKRWTTASVLELLEAIESVDDTGVRQTALDALEQRSPKYADVKDDLDKIVALTSSSDKPVAEAAKAQLVNAFLRAPIPECIVWIARGDATLDKLIWQQLDDRIARADATRKAGYRDAALEVLSDKTAKNEARGAGIDLLARVKDREVVGPVIDLLLALPQDLRPKAGKLLKDLTGQNFGPMPGDGTAEVTVAAKKWRTWWMANGGK